MEGGSKPRLAPQLRLFLTLLRGAYSATLSLSVLICKVGTGYSCRVRPECEFKLLDTVHGNGS